MSMTLTTAAERLHAAARPEDIFGVFTGVPDLEEALNKAYRQWARIVHPDGHQGIDKPIAEQAFKTLERLRTEAEERIANKVYGQTLMTHPVVLKNGKRHYTVNELLAHGNICEVYGGIDDLDTPVVVKVTRNAANNDLRVNESTVLTTAHKYLDTSPVRPYLPAVLDSFDVRDGQVRRINVFKRIPNLISLRAVIKAYPDGLLVQDASWMFNRMCAALYATHLAGYVHGAVLPEHCLICPEDHYGQLIGWSYAVRAGEPLKVIVSSAKSEYPPEALLKRPATFGTDLFMLARVFNAVVGKQPVPKDIAALMRLCLLGAAHRATDIAQLHADFKEALLRNYGPPKFRPFSLQTTQPQPA